MATAEVALVERAQAGEAVAFEAIFSQYEGPIYNYILRLIGNSEDAYDLTQDTFVKAYRGLSKTKPDLNLSAWLYCIATNTCRDELRRRKIIKWHPWDDVIDMLYARKESSDNPEKETLQKEMQEIVQRVLDKLPYRYRTCLILREFEGLSCQQIAKVLGTSRSAVKSLLFRAREEFRTTYRAIEAESI
ncbi:MAG: sigma-70 family RNA polymerase sigma factor [Chloroflexi bacterium]|nr:sigma-70 family RNA polymerase sigma factor [Chloroflexota bacterium]